MGASSPSPPDQRGLISEWGKVINWEKPGTRGQAACCRLWGGDGFQMGFCPSSRNTLWVMASSTSNPLMEAAWGQWGTLPRSFPERPSQQELLLPPCLRPRRGGQQDLQDPAVPRGPGCHPGQPALGDPSRPGSRTSSRSHRALLQPTHSTPLTFYTAASDP